MIGLLPYFAALAMLTIQAIGVFGMQQLREAVHVELWGLEGEEEEEEDDDDDDN